MNKFRFVSVCLALIALLGFVTFGVQTARSTEYSVLRLGSKGEDVRTLQKMLNLVDDADLKVDGDFGKDTQSAVRSFQSNNGLKVDGIAGPATWETLSEQFALKSSKLAIASGRYTPGTLELGSSYSISGKITSNYKITSVTVGVYKSDGSATAQVKTAKPNATSYDINTVNNDIKFGKLSAGTYSFKVVATDASGATKTLVNNSFTVKPQSAITIGSGKYEPGSLTVGKSYSINGKITSTYKLTSVTIGVYKADGSATAQVKTVKPNATDYDINNVNNSIKFGALSVGTYSFKVIATDAQGFTKTLVNNSFKVLEMSTLSMGSGKYSPGTLELGSSYSISGKITSNHKITSVTVGVYKTDGSATAQVKTVTPNATGYDINNVNNDIKFGKLGMNTYHFKVIATDASGTTKTLVNQKFIVKSSVAEAIEANALANWVAPVRANYLTIVGTGRAFGASRSDGERAHAAIDFYVRGGHGVSVYAMESGIVIEYVPYFYAGTSSVAIEHADGTILRYCEISSSLRVGDKVTRGQRIGKIIANTLDGGTMLHLELYAGTATGRLTDRPNETYDYAPGTKYNRRRDLMNPEFLAQITRTS